MKKGGIKYLAPSFLGVSLFFIVPFAISLYYTFTRGISEVSFVWLDNFLELFTNPAFALAAKNTSIFIIVGVPILLFFALMISLKLSNIVSPFAQWGMLSPMIIPAASAAMGWTVIFGNGGLLNQLITFLGGGEVSFLGEGLAKAVFVFIYIIKNLGYMTIVFTSAIAALPKDYKEAFSLDSASDMKFAFKIVIPEIMPVLFFAGILSVVNSFQIFREIYFVYGDFPALDVYILQYFMNNNFYNLNYQRLCTAAFIVILALSVLVGIYIWTKDRHTRRGGM